MSETKNDRIREYQADAYEEGWLAARDFYLSARGPKGGLDANPYRTDK